MVAKNTAETDDQIIDLTELIEKGEVPANDLSAQSRPPAHTEAEAEQEALNAQLRDLNDGSNVGDAEIDDLLAQMDIKNDGETDPSDVALDFAPPTTLTDHTVDPNEQLNMPGMGDVDNLLNSLDIPPQPGEREPEAAAPANADQAVDALLNDFNAATPAPQTAAAPAAQPAEAQSSIPDLDELLASVSPASPTGNLGGIDDLLNADRNAGQAQAPTAADTTFSDDDLDSLLDAAPNPLQSAAPAPAPAPAPAAAPLDANLDLGFDLDNLLAAAAEDLQGGPDTAQPQAAPQTVPKAAPAPASAAAPAPAPAPAPAVAPSDANVDLGFDLDNLLAAAAQDLQGGPDADQPQAAPQAAPASAAPAPAPAANADAELDIDSLLAAAPDASDDANVDLDSLLAAAAEDLQGAHDAPQTEAAPPSAAPEVADMDIDSLLAAGTPDAAPAADASVDAEVDFDSLLAAMSSDEAITGGAQEGVSDVLLHPELELMADMQPESMPDPLSEPMPELLPEQEPGSDLDSDLQAQSEETEELSADFDALLAEVTAEAAEDQTDAAQTDLPQAEMIDQQESDLLESTLAPESAEGEDLSLLEPDEIMPPDVSAQPEFADADMPQVSEKPAFDPSMYDLLATPAAAAAVAVTAAAVPEAEIEAVREQAKEASSHAIDAFAQALDASNRAAEAADMVHQLASRVEHCEHALQEAGERIIALETALESQIHAFNDLAAASLPRQELENMFVEGHPLHQYLMNCIEKAVAVALSSAPDAEPNAEDAPSLVEEKLQPVVTAARSASARLDALESRLDALEPRFNDRVERAAAAAAARILREEIGRLIEE